MKINLIILFCLSSFFFNGQINIGFSKNIDLYKPYTKEVQEYLKINDKIKSNIYNAFLNFVIIDKNKFSLKLGLCYKNTTFIVRDKVLSYYEYTYLGHDSPTDYVLKNNSLDLKSKSHSLGIMNEISLKFKRNNLINEVGISNEIHLFEYFKSSYYFSNTNESLDNSLLYITPLISKLPRNFFLSSANLSIIYRLTWQQSEKFSFSTKFSIGTNLYSDWDQFKKYAWLGVGLEMGFGKKKVKVPNVEK